MMEGRMDMMQMMMERMQDHMMEMGPRAPQAK